jgi:DNA-binding PadR family transcriptional regulator
MDRPVPDEVVLGLLKAQPAHGYELLAWFRSKSHLGRIWTMSTSQLYAVLKRLERDGAISGREIPTPNAPPRTEYEISTLGEDRLHRWLYDPHPSPSIHRIRVMFLSRVFIANLLNVSHGEIVKNQVDACKEQIDIFKSRKQVKDSDFEKLAVNYVISQLNSAVQWLEESEFELEIA